MAFEQRDNSGALFKNDKGDNEKRPDYRGDAMIDGVSYEMSAWVKDGKRGKFLSVSFKTKGEQQTKQQPAKQTAPDFDDEIPEIPF